MIRRFRLEQKSLYEKLVIAQRLSDMLEKFLDGRRAPLEIGAEQGGIEEWHDVVIVHSRELLEHLQVKRQTTDFCTKDPDMQVYLGKLAKLRIARKKKKAAKTAPDFSESVVTDEHVATDGPADAAGVANDSLSVLDSAFSSLSKHARAGTFAQSPERRFQLTLVTGHPFRRTSAQRILPYA